MVCFHEHKFEVLPWLKGVPFAWEVSERHEFEKGLDDAFDPYWNAMKEELGRHKVVGDSHSWDAYLFPAVKQRFPIDKVVYIVRNGIPNVHSLYYHNTSLNRGHWFYTVYLKRHWELLGKPRGEWETYTDWASHCMRWQTNRMMRDLVVSELGADRVRTYRFEDLLADAELAMGLVTWLNPDAQPTVDEMKLHQVTDVNQKIQGDRSSEGLWQTWTDEQRQIFTELCQESMSVFGYEIPPRP